MDIIPTNTKYTYSLLRQNLYTLLTRYPFLNVQTVGHSVIGKNIYVIKLGNGPNSVFYSGSIHANEWITSVILMKFIEDYCASYLTNSSLHGYNVRELFRASSIYIMPMVNPDGVDLVTGVLPITSPYYIKAKNIASRFSDIPFPRGWKANINAVDLNLQFPAGWEQAKEIKYSQGFNKPAPRDFVGYRSFDRTRIFGYL